MYLKNFILEYVSPSRGVCLVLSPLVFISVCYSTLYGQHTLDQLEYNYNSETNQLNYIIDNVSSSSSTVDLDNQNIDNYEYDLSGHIIRDELEGITEIQWTANGKVKQVSIDDNADGVADRIIQYKYDVLGNRVKKIDTSVSTSLSTTTYYIRDASGALLSVYKDEGSGVNRTETSISNGIDNIIPSSTISTSLFEKKIGYKNYELKDHLSNIRVVVTDVKNPNTTLTSFSSDVELSSDYYSYGMLMPGRDYNSSDYRFGFQGKEKNNEWGDNGVSYDFGARIYDSRVGRWLSIDAKASDYPGINPYNAFTNNPISYIDPDGKAAKDVVFDPAAGTVTISAEIFIYGTAVKAFREGRIPGQNKDNAVLQRLGTDHLTGMISEAIVNVWQVDQPIVMADGIVDGKTPMTFTVDQAMHDNYLRVNGVDIPVGTYTVAMDIQVKVYEADLENGPDAASMDPETNYVEIPWADSELEAGMTFESDGTAPSYVDATGGNGGQWFMNSNSSGLWTWGHELFHLLGGDDKYDGVYQATNPDGSLKFDAATGNPVAAQWNTPGAVRTGSVAQAGYEDNMAATRTDRAGNPSVADDRNAAEVIKYNARNKNISVK